jgi:cyclophilin family peptidyl-prolyl cis-trans isomerase
MSTATLSRAFWCEGHDLAQRFLFLPSPHRASVSARRSLSSSTANQPDNKVKIGLKHQDGAISMARDGPDTATSDFFICIGDQAELDFGGKRNPDGQGFAAFGRVVKGMDVMKKIQASKAEGQTLKPPVRIVKVTRKASR